MESSVMLGIIGIASALVAVLATVLNKLIDVIQKNTETNAAVSAAIINNTNELRRHDSKVKDIIEDIVPVISIIEKIPSSIEAISVAQGKIMDLFKEPKQKRNEEQPSRNTVSRTRAAQPR